MSETSAYAALLRTVQALAQRSGDDLWPSLLNSAVKMVPGTECGSIFIKSGSSYKTVAVHGYPNELLGFEFFYPVLEAWFGSKTKLSRAEPRIIKGQDLQQKLLDAVNKSLDTPETSPIYPFARNLKTNLCLPIVLGSDVVAFINLDNLEDEQAFTPESVVIAKLYVLQASALLASMFERQELETRLREFEAISGLSKALQSTLSFEGIVGRLAQEVSRLMNSAHVHVLLLHESGEFLEPKASLGLFSKLKSLPLHKPVGLSWLSLENRQVLRIDNALQNPHNFNPTNQPSPPHAQLTAPMFSAAGTPLGVIHTARELPQTFSEQDARTLEVIANVAATALERGLAMRQLELQLRQSQVMIKTLETVALGPIEPLWPELLRSAVELVPGAEGGSIWLKDGEQFVMVAQYAYDNQLLGERIEHGLNDFWFDLDEAKSSGDIQIRGRDFLDQAIHYQRQLMSPRQFRAFGEYGRLDEIQSTMSLPIFLDGEMLGYITLDSFANQYAFGEASKLAGRTFGVQLAALISAQRQRSEREAAYEGALRAIGIALEARDLETGGHTDRVSDLALRVGMELGLSLEALRELRWGSYLHDIGKLAVPDHILLKPTTLDTEEMGVMRSHSELGYRFTKNLPFLPETSREVVLYHHERFDGTGYPSGIQGEVIPIKARIFSVCDVFDALISARPYKLAWSTSDAIAEISRQAGFQFDPRVVQAFLKVLNTKGSLIDL